MAGGFLWWWIHVEDGGAVKRVVLRFWRLGFFASLTRMATIVRMSFL